MVLKNTSLGGKAYGIDLSSIQQDGVTVPSGTDKYEVDGKILNLTMSNGQSMPDEFSVKGNTLRRGNQTLVRRK